MRVIFYLTELPRLLQIKAGRCRIHDVNLDLQDA